MGMVYKKEDRLEKLWEDFVEVPKDKEKDEKTNEQHDNKKDSE